MFSFSEEKEEEYYILDESNCRHSSCIQGLLVLWTPIVRNRHNLELYQL